MVSGEDVRTRRDGARERRAAGIRGRYLRSINVVAVDQADIVSHTSGDSKLINGVSLTNYRTSKFAHEVEFSAAVRDDAMPSRASGRTGGTLAGASSTLEIIKSWHIRNDIPNAAHQR